MARPGRDLLREHNDTTKRDDDGDGDDVVVVVVVVVGVLVVVPFGLVLGLLAAAGLDGRFGRSELSS